MSNHYLGSAHVLTKAQMDVLVALGWLAPTWTPEEVRADKKKDGSPAPAGLRTGWNDLRRARSVASSSVK